MKDTPLPGLADVPTADAGTPGPILPGVPDPSPSRDEGQPEIFWDYAPSASNKCDNPDLRELGYINYASSAICHLLVTYQSGSYYATGFLIGSNVVVTSGHVLWRPRSPTDSVGERADTIVIAPARWGQSTQFGTADASRRNCHPADGWNMRERRVSADYGFIVLDDDRLAPAACLLYREQAIQEIQAWANRREWIVAGYPADPDCDRGKATFPYHHKGPISVEPSTGALKYSINATGGQSGAPVFYLDDSQRPRPWVIGIHSRRVGATKYGCRIQGRVLADMQQFAPQYTS